MNYMKLLQWLVFMVAWIGAGILVYAYSGFEEQLVTNPHLWIVVFIITGLVSCASIRLAQNIRK